jgi:GLPGLI family protein
MMPHPFHGFPGLVLEVYDQHYGIVKRAEKVEKVELKISLTPGAIEVTKNEWSKIRN